jgi:hypothetical protein
VEVRIRIYKQPIHKTNQLQALIIRIVKKNTILHEAKPR